MKKGTLAIIMGPAGSGKGTIIKRLLQDESNVFLSVSATTRNPRPGEEDGVSYYFTKKEDFERMIEEDAFFEHACYVGNYYGTPKAPVFERLNRGEHVLLEIEMQGAKQVKEAYPEAVVFFVMPPSVEELRRRLEGRGTETPEVVDQRMRVAIDEMEFARSCEWVTIVINDEVERAAAEIADLLRKNQK